MSVPLLRDTISKAHVDMLAMITQIRGKGNRNNIDKMPGEVKLFGWQKHNQPFYHFDVKCRIREDNMRAKKIIFSGIMITISMLFL